MVGTQRVAAQAAIYQKTHDFLAPFGSRTRPPWLVGRAQTHSGRIMILQNDASDCDDMLHVGMLKSFNIQGSI